MSVDGLWGGKSDLGSGRARVFISHSSQPDPFAADLRRRLADRLATDYDVLLDEQAIAAGDAWRAKLYRWLGTCEAAVIFLNRAVIDNPEWVRFETHVVSWRREFSDDVVIIPVLLPGVTSDDLQHIGLGTAMVDAVAGGTPAGPVRLRLRTSPIELTAYQFVQAAGQDPDPDAIVDQITQGIDAAVPRERADLAGPMADWVDEIGRYLPSGKPLSQAARELGVGAQLDEVVGGRPEDRDAVRKEIVAFALLFANDLDRVESATDKLLRDADFRARLHDFVPLVIPSWVGEAAGLAITDVRASEPVRRIVAMAVHNGRSMADVIRRATCCNTGDLVVEPVSANVLTETSLGIQRWYEDQVLTRYGFDSTIDVPGSGDVALVERSLHGRDKHLFVAVDWHALTSTDVGRPAALDTASAAQAVEGLRSRFPGAVFVLNAAADQVATLTTEDVPRCAPEIAAEFEAMQRLTANRLLNQSR